MKIKIMVDGGTLMPLAGSPWQMGSARAVAVAGLPSRL